MNGHIDLTQDSDDDDLQAAIQASLSENVAGSGSGGGSSTAGCSASSTSNSDASKRPVPKEDMAAVERHGPGKRLRVEPLEKSKPRSKAPLFRLLSSPTDTASAGAVSLEDLMSGEFHEALFANYMVDPILLMKAQPRLRQVPWVLVCGDRDDTEELSQGCRAINPAIKVHRPQYGVHHTKMMVMKFRTGIRVVVLTANFVEMDVGEKSQGVWYQEFPLRPSSDTCDFEDALVDYLDKVGGPASVFGRTLRDYDFRAARAVLVPSVPGTGKTQHAGPSLHKYGHMRVRAKLRNERVRLERGGHKVVMQISSLASLTDTPNEWLMELLKSFMPLDLETTRGEMSGGQARADATLKEHLRVVWPTVKAVRTSTNGWESGGSICGDMRNIFGGRYNSPDMAKYRANDPRPELKPLLRKWDGNPAVNRATDAPHIKTYLRYREVPGETGSEGRVDGDEVAWFLLTSSNLSRSAWGYLDKKTSQKLTVRSFELGVMFLPSLLGEGDPRLAGNDDLAFTCTPGGGGLMQRFPLTLSCACAAGKALPLKLLPMPYRLPAPRYDFGKKDEDNRPWIRDGQYATLDHTGRAWPGSA